MFSTLPKIKPIKRISSAEILLGKNIPKIDRLRGMNEDDFEDLVLEWADEFLKHRYHRDVKQFGGAGDKGRDVVGYYPNGDIDIYQCKHYDNAITPSEIWVEFGKLCYYTFNKDYPVPLQYVLVSPKGVGSKLKGYIDNPNTLRQELINNWKDKCATKITTTKTIKLSGAFEKYVKQFDFSIVSSKEPLQLINEHAQTRYHAMRFGGGLTASRRKIPKARKSISKRELKYIYQLFEVYSQELKINISSKEDLEKADKELFNHFNDQRDSFYSAESLDRFSRDNFPDSNPKPYEEVKDEIKSIISNVLMIHRIKSGWERLTNSLVEAQRSSFPSNALNTEIRAEDKSGICHHLANDNHVKWIK